MAPLGLGTGGPGGCRSTPSAKLEARVAHPLKSLTLDFSPKNFLIKLRWAVAAEGANPSASWGTKGRGFILASTDANLRTCCANGLR